MTAFGRIGLGHMIELMAVRLIHAGHTLNAKNRSRDKTKTPAQVGAAILELARR